MSSQAHGGLAPGATQSISVEVLDPKTAKTGMNPIRLLVKDASGKPIIGAQVDVGLFMPQMGAMAPMSSKATLTEAGQRRLHRANRVPDGVDVADNSYGAEERER